MQLSKGFDYAVRSLILLASLEKGSKADLRAIARSQAIPSSYLAKVMRALVRGGLVTSTLGREGGYALRMEPGRITLLMVYEIMEGDMTLVECMESEASCSIYGGCTQASVWRRIRSSVEGILRQTTLRSLLPPPPAGGEKERMEFFKEKGHAEVGA